MDVLSLDASSKKIGWAFFSNNELKGYGVLFADSKDKNATSRTEQLYNQLKQTIIKHKPLYIAFENTPGMNINITRMLSRVHGCILSLCFEHDIGIREYMPSEWRSAINLYDKSKNSKKEIIKNKKQ